MPINSRSIAVAVALIFGAAAAARSEPAASERITARSLKILEPIEVSTPVRKRLPHFPETGWNIDVTQDTKELVHTFKADLRRQIRRHWNILGNADLKKRSAAVQFELQPTGCVQGVRLVRGSGKAAFDRYALRAIEQAAPFSYLPKWITKPVALRMTFDKRFNSGFEDSLDALEVLPVAKGK